MGIYTTQIDMLAALQFRFSIALIDRLTDLSKLA